MSNLTRRNALRLGASLLALPLAAATANAAAHSTTHTVVIKGMKFTPADLVINAGDTVMWINEDSPRHSVTDLNGAFDTGLISKGASASLTFNGAGAFNYRCTPHGNMRGTITIN